MPDCELPLSIPASEARALSRPNLEAALALCIRKSQSNIARLADDPKAWGSAKDGRYWDDDLDFFSIGNWTTSFHTGMALLAWRETGDNDFAGHLLRLESSYRQKILSHSGDTMHDLGFLYSLYSVGLHSMTGDSRHRDIGIRAAEVLAARFDNSGKFIQAWGHLDGSEPHFEGLAIIDCMMNLPLIYWAAKETANPVLHDIAMRHADTTLKHFIRPDGSVYHAFRFDRETGAPIAGDNYCGHSVESHWARGMAWAIYGFALSYRYTGESRYLEASQSLANKFIGQLDEHVIPIWDFKLPAGSPPIRDSSAAAIAVCGFQELIQLGSNLASLTPAVECLLDRLCAEDYLDPDDQCPGVLRDAQTGFAGDVGLNAYASWGDYFLMEGLCRQLGRTEFFW